MRHATRRLHETSSLGQARLGVPLEPHIVLDIVFGNRRWSLRRRAGMAWMTRTACRLYSDSESAGTAAYCVGCDHYTGHFWFQNNDPAAARPATEGDAGAPESPRGAVCVPENRQRLGGGPPRRRLGARKRRSAGGPSIIVLWLSHCGVAVAEVRGMPTAPGPATARCPSAVS